jgi:hypothetical protein
MNPSELKAAWQLSFFIFVILILGILLLPTRGMPHDMELKIFLLLMIFLGVIFKSERDKRKHPSLKIFFNHVQSTILSIVLMIVFIGLLIWFDSLFIDWLGRNNSYGYIPYGMLTAVACYLIIRKNPDSVMYAPYIFRFPTLVSSLVGDFDPKYLIGWLLTAIVSTVGYYGSLKKAQKQ